MACNMQRFIKRWQRNSGIDDTTYRAFLESVTGKRSTTDMTRKERWRCVEALKAKGVRFDPASHTAPTGRRDARQDDDDQSRLARHLWLKLKNYGALRNSSEWSLLAYVERMTKRKRLEWCTHKQITKVIETLKKWVARIERDLINEALQSGRLALPPGFKSLRAVEQAMEGNFSQWMEKLHVFAQAQQAYLDTYTPPRERKAA